MRVALGLAGAWLVSTVLGIVLLAFVPLGAGVTVVAWLLVPVVSLAALLILFVPGLFFLRFLKHWRKAPVLLLGSLAGLSSGLILFGASEQTLLLSIVLGCCGLAGAATFWFVVIEEPEILIAYRRG